MKQTIKDIDVRGKKVLLRVDFNVPIDENGVITDATRINVELPTIKYLLMQNASVIICSHLGRPDGEVNKKYSLFPVARYLVKELVGKVIFANDCIGEDVENKAKNLKPGEVLVLENVRFHKEEEANDPVFAKKLASLADIYINDAFGTAHRKHASTYGVAKLHTATHLMQAGLQKYVSADIRQKGSNITPERLRFDFNCDHKLTPEELANVENFVNDAIKAAIPVTVETLTVDEAKASGALGVFDSKYGDKVTVYTIGDLSKEICGGPHAKNTSELHHFKIIKEESSSSGIRRIKAILD